MSRNIVWEDTIKNLLGDDNPCIVCLVQVTCRKSFSGNSACDKLAEKMTKALEEVYNENKT